ncbi:MAG TPA: alanine racemase [Nocardioidaceae bacterium]|nr:alanine racemase [Nocardioidaceae bacterium]
MTTPTAQLYVDLDAVAANTQLFAALTAGELMAVVKADAFGHGAEAVARTALASGASWLGVTSVEEALALRHAGIAAPVVSWLNPVDADFRAAVRRRVDLAVPGVLHLDAMARAAADVRRPAYLHLHVDLGMARDGCPPTEWDELCRLAATAERHRLVRVVGVMGHLACADQPGHPSNLGAARAFRSALDVAAEHGLRPHLRHVASTAAALTDPSTHHDLCRVGAGLYGIDPSGTTQLQPALTLTAPVVSVRDVPAGTPVGYGHTYATERATRLALLPVGYADGIPRTSRGFVSLDGHRLPVVGTVSMDQVVVDAGDAPVQPGDVAVFFGPGHHGEPTVAEWAAWSGTIAHEIVTGIGPRVRRTTVAASVRRSA